MNLAANRKRAVLAPLLFGSLGAGFVDTVAHDELDYVVDKYKSWDSEYKKVADQWPRVASAYDHLVSQGPFSIMDGYGILNFLKGSKAVDLNSLTNEMFQEDPSLRHMAAATDISQKLGDEERLAIQNIFQKELELMSQERLAEMMDPEADYSSGRVVAAAEAGEGTSPIPALIGGLTGGTGAALGYAAGNYLRNRRTV